MGNRVTKEKKNDEVSNVTRLEIGESQPRKSKREEKRNKTVINDQKRKYDLPVDHEDRLMTRGCNA